ncbi:MAG: DUF6111 family protein [Alphaproteobacteria bacterium]
MKLFLTKILPLLLPIAIYVGWLIHAHKRARALGTTKPRAIIDAPWPIMLLTGLSVMIFGMVALGLFTGEKPGGIYVPPHMENGEIVPGQIER